MPNIKPTSAMKWLGHALEVLATTVAVGVAIAVYQAVAAGNYSLQSLGTIAAAAALAVLMKGGASTIFNNPQFWPALLDMLTQLKAASTQPSPPQQAPVIVVHTTQPPIVNPTPPAQNAATGPPQAPVTAVVPPPQPPVTLPPGLFPPGTTFSFGDTGIVPIPPRQ